MTTQERLEKSRQELAEYQQIVQQDQRIDQDFYQQRLKEMRHMQQNHPDFSNLDLSDNMGGVGADPVVALVMGQLNIEARIRRLEAEAAQEPQVVAVPLAQIVQPPVETPPPPEAAQAAPQQQLSRWQRVKNWFKRTFSRNREEPSAGGPPPEPAPEPVQVQRDCRTVIPAIEATPVTSHVGEVQRFQKANPDDPGLATPEEMEAMRLHGARTGVGTFIAKRGTPTLSPIQTQTTELFNNLQANGFDFQTALSGMKEFKFNVGSLNVNQATVAMVARTMRMWDEYLENEHIQEYITMIYQSVGKVLMDNVKSNRGENAFPTAEEFDNHIMEILPTRGLETYRSHFARRDISPDNKRFAMECSKLFGKMERVEELCASCNDPETVALFQPAIQQYRILKQKISQIGAPMREQRLREMKNPAPPPAGGAAT